MNTSSLVKPEDLKIAADDYERDATLMESLGYPVSSSRSIPHLLRRAALELETLKMELWRVSQGNFKS